MTAAAIRAPARGERVCSPTLVTHSQSLSSRRMANEAWRSYEQDVADLFQEAGLDAEMHAIVAGARASHEVDVAVSVAQQDRPPRLWLTECKRQSRPVPKSSVLTFKGVIEDVGAERGFLVSEAGFQPAAIAAAHRTNIVLCSLEELRDEVRDIRRRHQLQALEVRADAARRALNELQSSTTYPDSQQHGDLFVHALNWKQWIHWKAGISDIIGRFADVRADRWPVTAGYSDPLHWLDSGERLIASDAEEFIAIAGAFLAAAESWTDAAQRWLAVEADDNSDESRELARALVTPFLTATWTPPGRQAGPVRQEAAAFELLLAATSTGVGYHATHTEEGDAWAGVYDRDLYFVVDDVATVRLSAEAWVGAGPSDQRRLVFAPTYGPISAIELEVDGLGAPTRLTLLRDSQGTESGARVEFADGAVLYAWVDNESDVGYDMRGFPSWTAFRRGREITRQV